MLSEKFALILDHWTSQQGVLTTWQYMTEVDGAHHCPLLLKAPLTNGLHNLLNAGSYVACLAAFMLVLVRSRLFWLATTVR